MISVRVRQCDISVRTDGIQWRRAEDQRSHLGRPRKRVDRQSQFRTGVDQFGTPFAINVNWPAREVSGPKLSLFVAI